ncbi:glycoside hydrolase family 97 catalytic domain-containing protein [uncultured Bacteroides sp.]|uniref:glycoside hydrolase family 97 protein n=1 Tax=uncultured Bacteroides sp. TaxID=162156 RepID=UPI002AAB7FAD|nr:glycoside hydrolase family 97 catalytic domain-containing protein [uncultured Bacteroides sp.]
MKKIIPLTLLMLFFVVLTSFSKDILTSPDARLKSSVYIKHGKPFCQLTMDGVPIVNEILLGIKLTTGDFTSDLKLVDSSEPKYSEESYSLVVGKKKQITTKANYAVYTFNNAEGKEMKIEFRLANDGLAFRYLISGGSKATVMEELTAFQISKSASGFLHPMSKAHSSWARTNPSYEEHYAIDAPVTTISKDKQGWCFPALFKLPLKADKSPYWFMLSEAGTDGNYCATHLADATFSGLFKIAYSEAEQNIGTDPVYPTFALPFATPWRMIVVGDNLKKIVESTMATDLVKPKYEAKYDYKPGKASWSWLVLKDNNTTYEVQRQFIDMAAQLKLEYCLIDALWDTKIGRERMKELADYAKTKNVSLILWYNSNGKWNDADQTPKDKMDTRDIRREEMKWMQSIGVKGIKVDFFGGDKQATMKLYEDILTDANDFDITVNFHGTTLPRGWERMYPNFVTAEAVKGMEFCTFGQEAENLRPQHACVLPFVRNAVAPMDFTPLILNPTLGEKKGTGPVRRTTNAFELALPVIFFSGVQHLGLLPQNLEDYPAYVADYLSAVPSVWDETKLIDGYPGKFLVIARRSGDRWFIGAINGENTEKTIELDLSFIKDKQLNCIADGEDGTLTNSTITAEKSLSYKLKAHGGLVIY